MRQEQEQEKQQEQQQEEQLSSHIELFPTENRKKSLHFFCNVDFHNITSVFFMSLCVFHPPNSPLCVCFYLVLMKVLPPHVKCSLNIATILILTCDGC